MFSLLNYQLFQKISLKDAKLRAVEMRNDSIIDILRRKKEKLAKKSKPMKSSAEKFDELKQRQSAYTFKLRDGKKQKCEAAETFKHGWRVRSESRLPERVKELSQRRSKMIVIGNSHSLSNKTSPRPATCRESDNRKSLVEMRQEMLIRSKQLGNRFSHAFVNRQKASTNKHKFDCNHRLMSCKLEAEQVVQHVNNPPELFRENYTKLKSKPNGKSEESQQTE